MRNFEELRQSLSDATKDARLNISSVLKGEELETKYRWTIAICCAYFLRNKELRCALIAEAGDLIDQDLIDDAKAAAAIMAMNTIYYRTEHVLGNEDYENLRPGVRMNRMAKPSTSKMVFELCSIACAALAGCTVCVNSHEHSLRAENLEPVQIHQAIRIASVVNGFICSIESEQE